MLLHIMSCPSHCVTWVETVQITLERRRSYPGTSMPFIGNMLRVRNLDRGDLNHTRDGCRDAAQEYQIPPWTRRYDLERTCDGRGGAIWNAPALPKQKKRVGGRRSCLFFALNPRITRDSEVRALLPCHRQSAHSPLELCHEGRWRCACRRAQRASGIITCCPLKNFGK